MTGLCIPMLSGSESGCIVWDWLCDAGNDIAEALSDANEFFLDHISDFGEMALGMLTMVGGGFLILAGGTFAAGGVVACGTGLLCPAGLPAIGLGTAAAATGIGIFAGGAAMVANGYSGLSDSAGSGGSGGSGGTSGGISSERIPYNSDELSRAAYKARIGNGISDERNVAVARVPGWNDPNTGDLVIGYSKGRKATDSSPAKSHHSEKDILDQLEAKGFTPNQVTELYTERQPCGKCGDLLEGALSPGTPIRYSVPYGNSQAEREAALDLLRMFIDRAGGR